MKVGHRKHKNSKLRSTQPAPAEVWVSDSLISATKSRWGIFTFHYKAKCFSSCMKVPLELVFEREMRPCRFCVPDWQEHPLYLKHALRKQRTGRKSAGRKSPSQSFVSTLPMSTQNCCHDEIISPVHAETESFDCDFPQRRNSLSDSSNGWTNSETENSIGAECSSSESYGTPPPLEVWAVMPIAPTTQFSSHVASCVQSWTEVPPNAVFDPNYLMTLGWSPAFEPFV